MRKEIKWLMSLSCLVRQAFRRVGTTWLGVLKCVCRVCWYGRGVERVPGAVAVSLRAGKEGAGERGGGRCRMGGRKKREKIVLATTTACGGLLINLDSEV